MFSRPRRAAWGATPFTRPTSVPSPVLVTGATSGIGAAVAEALVRAGAHVVGVGRSAEKAAAVQAKVAGAPGRVTFVLGDATLMRDALRLAGDANAAAGAPFAAVVHCMGTLSMRATTTHEGLPSSYRRPSSPASRSRPAPSWRPPRSS